MRCFSFHVAHIRLEEVHPIAASDSSRLFNFYAGFMTDSEKLIEGGGFSGPIGHEGKARDLVSPSYHQSIPAVPFSTPSST